MPLFRQLPADFWRASSRWMLVAFAIGAACRLGVDLTAGAGRIASVWLANGALLGIVLRASSRRWPAYFVAAFAGNLASNLSLGDGLLNGALLALCNSLEVAVGASLIRYRLGPSVELRTPRDLGTIVLCGMIVGPAVSTIAASALLASTGPGRFAQIAAVWFRADALGIAIVTPLWLEVSRVRAGMPEAIPVLKAGSMPLLLLGLATWLLYSQGSYPLLFLVFPPLLYLVFRAGSIGAVAGVAVIAAIAIAQTLRGLGPLSHFEVGSLRVQILLLQVFVITCSASALSVAVALEERRRLQQRIEQAERDLRAVFDNLPTLIARVDSDQRFRMVNQQFGRSFGGDASRFLGQTLADAIGRRYYKKVAPQVMQALSGQSVSFENRLRVGRSLRDFQSNYIPDTAPDGSIRGFYSITVDITAQKAAERRLARDEKWLQTIADNVSAVICYVDRDERYRFANRFYQKVFGLPSASILGRSLREVMGPDGYADVAGHVASALRGQPVRYERHARERGLDAYLLTDYVPDFDDAGQVQGFFISILDITARKKAELRLGASEARLRTITDGLPGLIAYLDRGARVRFCNATYEKWFGVPPSELVGHRLDDVLGDYLLESQRDHVTRALQGERVETEFEIEYRGKRRHVHATYLPHRNVDGQVQGVYSLTTDISPLKKVQKQLVLIARHDTLTGLPNRGEFNNRLREALSRCRGGQDGLGLLFLDVDHFKSINDRYGHAAGDEVLQEVAIRLQSSIRKTDIVARLAGDEFVILLEHVHSVEEPQFVARKIITAMSRSIRYHETEIAVGVSIGVIHSDGRADTSASDLLIAADKALYDAKAAGRNTFHLGVSPTAAAGR